MIVYDPCSCNPVHYAGNLEQAMAQLVEHCATNQKVAVSIPDGVLEIFLSHNPSCRATALGLTQPVTKMSKGGRSVVMTLPSSCANCLEIWEPHPYGTLRACPGL